MKIFEDVEMVTEMTDNTQMTNYEDQLMRYLERKTFNNEKLMKMTQQMFDPKKIQRLQDEAKMEIKLAIWIILINAVNCQFIKDRLAKLNS